MEFFTLIVGTLVYMQLCRFCFRGIIAYIAGVRIRNGENKRVVESFNHFLAAVAIFIEKHALALLTVYFFRYIVVQAEPLSKATILLVLLCALLFSFVAFCIVFVQVCISARLYKVCYYFFLRKLPPTSVDFLEK